MAGEFGAQTWPLTTSGTLYWRLRSMVTNQIWNTVAAALQAYDTAQIANYDLAASQQGTASGYWVGNMPAAPAGSYSYVLCKQAGGSPAEADQIISTGGTLRWDGAAVVLDGDLQTIKGNAVVNAGTVTFPTDATLASTTNITAGTITTVTTLTNLPAITANWLTAAGIAAGALNGKGDWLLASSYTAPPSAAANAAAVWGSASRTLTAFGFTVSAQLADGVTHGGTTALLRLGGGNGSIPSFYVTNTAAGGRAVLFEASNGGNVYSVSFGDGDESRAAFFRAANSGGAVYAVGIADADEGTAINLQGQSAEGYGSQVSLGAASADMAAVITGWAVTPTAIRADVNVGKADDTGGTTTFSGTDAAGANTKTLAFGDGVNGFSFNAPNNFVVGSGYDGQTFDAMLRLISAVLCGKASGGPSGTVFRSMNDAANRVTSVDDSNGNRTTVTLTP